MKSKGRSGGGRNPYVGQQVRTIHGQQSYVTVQNGSNGTQLFTSTNAVAVSPDSFGTEIADIANHYNQYQFTKLVFEYKPVLYNAITSGPTGSQSNNLFAFGFEEDGQLTFTVTHNNIAALQHQIVVPATGYMQRAANKLTVRLTRSKWYYNKDDTSSSATIRQTIQGILYGEALRSITDVTLYGEIIVRYTIRFRDLCPSQGFTLSGILRELRLGSTSTLEQMLKTVEVAARYESKQFEQVDKDPELRGLTNEEYMLITGHGRSPALPMTTDPLSSYLALRARL